MTLLIAAPGCEDHATRLGAQLALPVVVPALHRFPDGELLVRIERERIDGGAAIVGNLTSDSFLPMAFLAGTARDLGASSVGLVAPYLAYMRQDARFKPGEGVTAQYFGRLVSSTVDWLVTIDPHLHRLDSLAHVYSIPTTIGRAAPLIARWIGREVERPMLVGPDAESVQWVAAVAAACGAPYVILEKTRRGDRDVSISAPPDQLAGHTPVLIDDIVSTGRTMLEAVRQLRAAGSAPPVCIAIHAVFADSVERDLVEAGAQRIVTCDTLPHGTNRIAIADALAAAVLERL